MPQQPKIPMANGDFQMLPCTCKVAGLPSARGARGWDEAPPSARCCTCATFKDRFEMITCANCMVARKTYHEKYNCIDLSMISSKSSADPDHSAGQPRDGRLTRAIGESSPSSPSAIGPESNSSIALTSLSRLRLRASRT
jgi:hypothetical protein